MRENCETPLRPLRILEFVDIMANCGIGIIETESEASAKPVSLT